MSALTRKRKIRGGHRGSATRSLSEVYGLIEDYDSALEIRLKQKKITLEEILITLKTLDEQILDLTDEDDDKIAEEIEEANKFRERIHEALLRIDSILSTEKKNEGDNVDSHSNASNSSSQARAKMAKLPKLTLKKFNGNPLTWQSWWDSYESAVDSNDSLMNIDKFIYLKTLLEGQALACITGLQLTATNYPEAIETLKERFGVRQLIINAHMDSLIKLPMVNSMSDIRKLRSVYDQIESRVRGLQGLGVNSDSYGNLLIPIMLNKIPEELKLLISRKFKKDEWDLDSLLKEFQSELEARERIMTVSSNMNVMKVTPYQNRPSPRTSFPTAAALLSPQDGNMQGQSVRPVPTCSFCRQRHVSASCNVVTDLRARRTQLRIQGRCYLCLKRSHLARDCTSSIRCLKCAKRHHVAICDTMAHTEQHTNSETEVVTHQKICITSSNETERNVEPGSTTEVKPEPGDASDAATSLYVNSTTRILLQTARALVSRVDGNYEINARILFDSGSQRSYVTSNLKDHLELPSVRKEKLLIKTFGNECEQITDCEVVQLRVKPLYDDLSIYLTAYSIPVICSPILNQPVKFAAENYEHLKGLKLADITADNTDPEITILIGSDQIWNFLNGDTIRGQSGPIALHTKLGYVLSGPVENVPRRLNDSYVNLATTHVLRSNATEVMFNEIPEEISKTLDYKTKQFFDLETIGIKPEEASVHEVFLENIKFDGNNYVVRLPFRESAPLLPDNYELSVKRLHGVLNRLRKQPDLLKEYDGIIKDQTERGILENVDLNIPTVVSKTHYLPHHPVVREDKETTRVRVVFDASAKVSKNSPSLNNILHSGPSLIPNIVDILIRFRWHRIPLISDIEKAFLMVKVDPDDRDCLRMLWVENVYDDNPRIVIKRFTTAVFGVTSSPFLLGGTIKHHMLSYETEDEFIQQFLNSIYVDDVLTGNDTVPEAFKFYCLAKERMKEGGFNLRKWLTSNEKLAALIAEREFEQQPPGQQHEMKPSESFAKSSINNMSFDVINTEFEQKVLGLVWNFKQDLICFKPANIIEISRSLPTTKRGILGLLARIYDPLGLFSPATICLKLLFQELCEKQYDWDIPLSRELHDKHLKWLSDLKALPDITIPRCYLKRPGDFECIEIHGFADASQFAFASCVYLRIIYPDTIDTVLVAAKNRIAPIKKPTIPRLELLAALITARLVNCVKIALEKLMKVKLDQNQQYFWSDSLTTLFWIRGENKQWKMFVENRVKEIRKIAPTDRWLYCNTMDNPADIPTRGIKFSELHYCTKWWIGPDWLALPEDL